VSQLTRSPFVDPAFGVVSMRDIHGDEIEVTVLLDSGNVYVLFNEDDEDTSAAAMELTPAGAREFAELVSRAAQAAESKG